MKHKTCVIDKNAKISKSATIGPYSIIGPKVEIGDQVEIYSHVNIEGNTKIGPGTKIFPFASIGTQPQDLKYQGEKNSLLIGKNNIWVSMNQGIFGVVILILLIIFFKVTSNPLSMLWEDL